jgi:hypothetical protein
MTSQLVTRQGTQFWNNDADGGLSWWVYPASLDDEAILEDLASDGAEPLGYHGGPGRPFAHGVGLWRAGSRVLVTQSFGLDV